MDDDVPTVGATWRVALTKNTFGLPVWQRNYYERILRNERKMDRIHRYIESNPSLWVDNEENPINV